MVSLTLTHACARAHTQTHTHTTSLTLHFCCLPLHFVHGQPSHNLSQFLPQNTSVCLEPLEILVPEVEPKYQLWYDCLST